LIDFGNTRSDRCRWSSGDVVSSALTLLDWSSIESQIRANRTESISGSM
jgi:hypothetical protein